MSWRWLIVACVVACVLVCPIQIFAQTGNPAAFEPVVAIGHTGEITSVAFSPDGRTLVSGGNEGSVKFWDVSSGRMLRTFAAHSSVTSVAFSPDGEFVLSGGDDRTPKLWNVRTGQKIREFTGHSAEIGSVAFSADGRVLTGSWDWTVRLWSLSGKPDKKIEGHGAPVNIVRFSPDGRKVLSGGARLKLWDAASGKLIHDFSNAVTLPECFTGCIYAAFSPDGRKLVATISPGNKLNVLDAASGAVLSQFAGQTANIKAVAFTSDGAGVLVASLDGTLKLWDASGGGVVREFVGHTAAVNTIAIAPDGRTAVSAGADRKIIRWDLASGQSLQTYTGEISAVTSVVASQDGRMAIAGHSDRSLSKWSLVTGEFLGSFVEDNQDNASEKRACDDENECSSLALSSNGLLASSISQPAIKLWNVSSGKMLRKLDGSGRGLKSIAFSPDGRSLVSMSDEGVFSQWDVDKAQKIRTITSKNEGPSEVCVSPDGKTAYTADYKVISLWDLQTGRSSGALKGHTNQIGAMALSSDGSRLLSSDWDGNLKLWDLSTKQPAAAFSTGASATGMKSTAAGATSLAWAYDRRSFLAAGIFDSTITRRELPSGKMTDQIRGHLSDVTGIRVFPDGNRFLSASKDGTVKVWRSSDGALLATMVSLKTGEWITVTPEGFFDSSVKGARLLSVIRGIEATSIDQFYDALHRPDLVQQKLAGDPKGLVKAAAAKLDLDKVVSSGDAPAVTITSSPATVSDAQTVIEATVTERGGGIGRVEWRNNKKTIDIDTASGAASSASGRTATLRKTIPLVAGDNVIELKAYNGQNLVESETVQVTVKRIEQPQVKVTRPQLYVLAVGVNDYWDSKLRLNFAVPDARSVVSGLQQAGGRLYERVNVTTVLDADVSAARLDRVFAELKDKVQAQDVFVFFLSGHGKAQDGRFYYIPQDFRYNGAESIVQNAISHDRLKGWITQIPALKSVLLFDACDSGALIQQQIAMRGLDEKTALDHLVRATGATVLTATTEDKPAAEGYRGHGVFTYTLLSAFANADANGDGFIDVQELAVYVAAQVPALTDAAWGIRQSPQFNVVGSIYPLVAKTSLLPATADGPVVTIPATPTHVVIAASTVRQSASVSSGAVVELSPGMQVRLMEASGGWILVAREGKKLGYVDAKALLGLQ